VNDDDGGFGTTTYQSQKKTDYEKRKRSENQMPPGLVPIQSIPVNSHFGLPGSETVFRLVGEGTNDNFLADFENGEELIGLPRGQMVVPQPNPQPTPQPDAPKTVRFDSLKPGDRFETKGRTFKAVCEDPFTWYGLDGCYLFSFKPHELVIPLPPVEERTEVEPFRLKVETYNFATGDWDSTTLSNASIDHLISLIESGDKRRITRL